MNDAERPAAQPQSDLEPRPPMSKEEARIRDMSRAILEVVWGYDPEEVFTATEEAQDLLRVWERIKAELRQHRKAEQPAQPVEAGRPDLAHLKELLAKATRGTLGIVPTIVIGHEGGKHGYREVGSDKSACWIARFQAFHDGLIDKASPEWEANAELYVAVVNALPALIQWIEDLQADRERLISGLSGVMAMIDGGLLVRDISRDHEPGWALQQLPMVLALKGAANALDAARTKGEQS